MDPALIEALGYVASFIILVSLTMKSIVRLRWINAAGSLLFVAFAVLTRSLPTVVMNIGIIAIDLFYVFRMARIRSDYRMVHAERNGAFLNFFYERHRAEIDGIFGDEAFAEATSFAWFVVDDEIAGLFAWRDITPSECRILIDYVTARYRDTRVGRFFFEDNLPLFRERGYVSFRYLNVGEPHWKYLRKIGFTEDSPGCFSKKIDA